MNGTLARHGRALTLGYVPWALTMGFVLLPLVASIPLAVQGLQAAGLAAQPLIVGVKLLELLIAGVYASAAVLLLWLRPADRMVHFIALTLLCMGAVESGVINALIDRAIQTPDGLRMWSLPVMLVRALEMICALTLLYVYPDGRFQPAWTRPLAAVWAALNVAWALLPALPLNVLYGPTWRATPLLSLLFSGAWVLSGVIARVSRQRAAAPDGVRPVSWSMMLIAVWFLVYAGLPLLPLSERLGADGAALLNTALLTLVLLGFPIALFRSMLRHGLHDGQRLIGRALTGVVLSVTVAGTYLFLMLGVAQAFGVANTLVLSVLATIFATLVFAPIRDRVQRRVNHWLYGDRDQPLSALLAVTTRLEQARTPQGALSVLAEVTATALKLPYLALRVRTPELDFSLELGQPGGAQESFPLVAGGHEVGTLDVRAGAPLTRDVQALLRTVAQQAARSVENWQLSVQVQRSRQGLVDTREDERRRLRRDLHDGLGPTLAAQTLRIGSARALLGRDDGAVAGLLERLESDVEQAIADVRRVVEDLRPPALDDLGLPGALERAVTELAPDSLPVRVHVRSPLPPLRAAVEVAAYRIAMEAVTNVVKHAHAGRCSVQLGVRGDALEVQVDDDGRGGAWSSPSGVGLRAMRERAEELGGSCHVQALTPRGTRVQAALPLTGPLAEPLTGPMSGPRTGPLNGSLPGETP